MENTSALEGPGPTAQAQAPDPGSKVQCRPLVRETHCAAMLATGSAPPHNTKLALPKSFVRGRTRRRSPQTLRGIEMARTTKQIKQTVQAVVWNCLAVVEEHCTKGANAVTHAQSMT